MNTFFIMLMIISACKTSNIIDSPQPVDKVLELEQTTADCPKEGVCSIKLHKNAEVIIKKDTTGSYYPVIESGNNLVVMFEFLIKGPEGTVDGEYSETIHFEIASTSRSFTLNDNELEDVKLIYGKHCFCRGEAGYYKVNNGSLNIQKSKNEIVIDLEFSIKETSHKISKIKETIKI